MPSSADALRRWFGLFFLALAAGMLIWGQTVLKSYLKGLPYLVYWFFCFLFTFCAIITALLDLRATRRRTRAEHRELIERTLTELEENRAPKEE